MTEKKTVALLCGGRSSEHPISLITAAGVLGAIDRTAYDVITIGITRDGRWYLTDEQQLAELTAGTRGTAEFPAGTQQVFLPMGAGDSRLTLVDAEGNVTRTAPVDVVFPLLHGPFGEDGTVQGLLEMADLHYVGCGVTASAVGMDKHFMKVAFESAGLEVGPYEVVTNREWEHEDREQILERVLKLGFPLFVKPTRAGSSFGITKVDSVEELVPAIEEARRHDPKIIIEAGIVGREIECAVLDGHHGEMPRASYPGEIEVVDQDHGFYDFEAKYVSESSAVTVCPANLPQDVQERLRELAVKAFLALDGEGLSRADFFYTEDGRLVINEVNTMPGFTPISMYKTMWENTGISYTDLISELLTLAMERPLGLR